jgi:hypothetical protein
MVLVEVPYDELADAGAASVGKELRGSVLREIRVAAVEEVKYPSPANIAQNP